MWIILSIIAAVAESPTLFESRTVSKCRAQSDLGKPVLPGHGRVKGLAFFSYKCKPSVEDICYRAIRTDDPECRRLERADIIPAAWQLGLRDPCALARLYGDVSSVGDLDRFTPLCSQNELTSYNHHAPGDWLDSTMDSANFAPPSIVDHQIVIWGARYDHLEVLTRVYVLQRVAIDLPQPSLKN